jgi:AraC-like DNA-binding protein/mannose-6-phosphate isomerase-like protein (cupin superfamily)
MAKEIQLSLLDLIAKIVPQQISALTPEQVVISGQEHPRSVSRSFPEPEYLGFAKRRHITPEYCYVVKGPVGFTCDRFSYQLKTGDFCFVPPGLYHYESPARADEPYELLWTRVPVPGEQLIWMVHCRFGGRQYVFNNVARFDVTYKGLPAIKNLEKDSSVKVKALKDELAALFKMLAGKIRSGNYFFHEKHVQEKKWRQKSLPKVVEYIQEHLTEKLTVQKLAQQISVSPRYLSQLFKKEYGYTVMTFIRNRKLSHSLVLLENPDLAISEIARQLGFSDIYHFSKVFKQYYGISPTEYRTKYL